MLRVMVAGPRSKVVKVKDESYGRKKPLPVGRQKPIKPAKPTTIEVEEDWKTGYGIKGYPAPNYPPRGMTKVCEPFWNKIGPCYDKDHCSVLHPKRYGGEIFAAYKARGLAAAWACAVIIFKRSCEKNTGKKAFPGSVKASHNSLPKPMLISANAEKLYKLLHAESEQKGDIVPGITDIMHFVQHGNMSQFVPEAMHEFVFNSPED